VTARRSLRAARFDALGATRHLRPGVVAAIFAGAMSAAPLAAQTLVPPTAGIGARDVGRVHVEPRPGSPAIAAVLALPVGAASDPDGREGAARALAGAVARQVETALGPAGGEVQVEVTPDRTLLTMIAAADHWRGALGALIEGAFRAPPEADAVAAELASLLETSRFEVGAPILDVRREVRALLYGAGTPATRPPDGTIAGLEALTTADLAAFQREHYRPGDATMSLVGVSDGDEALTELGASRGTTRAAAVRPDTAMAGDSASVADTVAAVPATDDPPAPAGPTTTFAGATPWAVADRVRVVQDVTNSWIVVAYPVPDDMPRTLLDFVAHRLQAELNPSPPDPGLFSARVDVRTVPGGLALVAEVAVLPDAAARWEPRVPEAMATLARPAVAAFFVWQRRRFRAATLLGEASPEGAARRQALDLLATGDVRDVAQAVWTIDSRLVAAAVSALGPPRTLVYGPDLGVGEAGTEQGGPR
jgi:hypothetical protein